MHNLLPTFIFLCWGSFLNVVAYRLIKGGSLFSCSRCPHCRKNLLWYDLIPIISWLALDGHCRFCKKPISWLYPFIELITAASCTLLLYKIDSHYFFAYFLLTTALIIVVRTDLEFMLIPRLCSLYLIPVGFFLSVTKQLPISPVESICGALMGYLVLACVSYLYTKRTGNAGMGEGDPELLAGIGAFVGVTGIWYTLLIGSLTATIYALLIMLVQKATAQTKIPFGPFLALGAFSALFCCGA
jgi:leader peptidase (prepilin peptidase)/N-methyltransferase